MKKVYYEDLNEGSVHWGGECIVDKDEMLEYNRKNDPWPFHVDEKVAAQSPFGGLIASSGYTITLMCRLGYHKVFKGVFFYRSIYQYLTQYASKTNSLT